MKSFLIFPILALCSVPDRTMHRWLDSEPDYDMTKPVSGPSADFDKQMDEHEM